MVRMVEAWFAGKNVYRRFWVLETVARVPYFSYLSVLHLRQTLGARESDSMDRIREHFAEADNEALHLLVMEELGGGAEFMDRFLAQHVAVIYFCTLARYPQERVGEGQ